jgi:hypothetical protein
MNLKGIHQEILEKDPSNTPTDPLANIRAKHFPQHPLEPWNTSIRKLIRNSSQVD